MNDHLTPAQAQLVADHMPLARSIARHYNPDDEYEGVACEALCEAARVFADDGRARFESFLTIVVRRRMYDFYRTWNQTRTLRRLTPVALTDDIVQYEVGDDRRPLDTTVAEQIDNEALIARLRPKLRDSAARIAAGVSHLELAADSGVTGSAISQMLKAERRRLAHFRAA